MDISQTESTETYKAFEEILKTAKFEEKTVEFRFSQLAERFTPTDGKWTADGIPGNTVLRILQPMFRMSRSGSSGSTVIAPDTFVIRTNDSLDEDDFDGNTFLNQKHIVLSHFKVSI